MIRWRFGPEITSTYLSSFLLTYYSTLTLLDFSVVFLLCSLVTAPLDFLHGHMSASLVLLDKPGSARIYLIKISAVS
jgi:hypothetical protein